MSLERVVKVFIGKNKPALSIEYEYQFPGRAKVHIQNLGAVPASGRFRYLTTDGSLRFSDTDSGALITEVPLFETLRPAAKPPLREIADESDFPAAHRAYGWHGREALAVRANAVLGRYFRYRPYERDGRTFIVTTFSPLKLQGVPEGVTGQIAILLSFPYAPGANSFDFHMKSLVLEGRTHSDDLRNTSDPALVRAADAFVDRLVTEMLSRGQP